MDAHARRPWRTWVAVTVGLLALVFVRLRGDIGFWVQLHRWLRDRGVPDAVRNLDATALLVLASLFGARLAAGRGGTLAALGLRSSLRTGLWFGGVAGAPMFLQAMLSAPRLDLVARNLDGMLVAPFVEELLFRGLLVAVPSRDDRGAFWPLAILSGLVFGSLHVPWDDTLLDAGSLIVLLVTAAGGIWFAWICRTLRWNLWSTIVLHAVMNAGWLWFGVPGGAMGDPWSNVGRAVTIALGTVLALRWRKRADGAAT